MASNVIAQMQAILSFKIDSKPFEQAESSIKDLSDSLVVAQKKLSDTQKKLKDFNAKKDAAKGLAAKAAIIASRPSGLSGKSEKLRVDNITKAKALAEELNQKFLSSLKIIADTNIEEKKFLTLQKQLIAASKKLKEMSSSTKNIIPEKHKEIKAIRKTFAEIEALQKQHIINTAVQDKEGNAQIRADADRLHKEILAKQREAGSTSLKIEKDYKKAIEEVNKRELDFKELQQKTLISSELDASKKRTSIKLAEARRQMALDKRVQKLSRDSITKTVDTELSLLKAGKGKSATLQKQYDEIIATSTNKRLALLKLEDAIRARVSKNALRDLTRRLTYEHGEKAILEKLSSVKKVLGVETEIAEVKASAAASKSHAKAKEAQFDLKKLNKLLVENKRLRDRIGKQNDTARRASSTEGLKKQAKAVGWLSHNFRDLSSTSVLALGPLSGIGSRISAIGAIAGRTNIKMALILATIGGGLAIFWKFSKSIVRIRKELDSAVVLLNKSASATENAGEGFEFLAKQSLRFGANFSKIARPFARLRMSMRQTSIQGISLKNMMSDILNISGKFQLDGDSIGGVIKAVEQMVSKGLIQAEELRGQLGDRLPGVAVAALATFQKAFGNADATMADFLKAMKNRAIDSERFLSIFFKEYKRLMSIDGSSVDTLNAAFQRLNTSVDLFIYDLDKTLGLSDSLKSGMNLLSGVLKVLRTNVKGVSSSLKTLVSVGSIVAGLWIFKAAKIGKTIKTFSRMSKSVGTLKHSLRSLFRVGTKVGTAVPLVLLGAGGLKNTIFDKATTSNIKSLTRELKTMSDVANNIDIGSSDKIGVFDLDGDFRIESLQKFIKTAKKVLDDGLIITPSINIDDNITNEIDKIRSKILLAEYRIGGLSKNSYSTDRGRKNEEKRSNFLEISKLNVEVSNNKKLINLYKSVKEEAQLLSKEQNKIAESIEKINPVIEFLINNLDIITNAVIAFGTGWSIVKFTSITSGFLGISGALSVFTGKMKIFNSVGKKGIGIFIAIGAGLYAFSERAKAAERNFKETVDLVKESEKFLGSRGVKGERIIGLKKYRELNVILSKVNVKREFYKKLNIDLLQQERDLTKSLEKRNSEISKGKGGIFSSSLLDSQKKKLSSLRLEISRIEKVLEQLEGKRKTLISVEKSSKRFAQNAERGIRNINVLSTQPLLDINKLIESNNINIKKLSGSYTKYNESIDSAKSAIKNHTNAMIKGKVESSLMKDKINELSNSFNLLRLATAQVSFDKVFDSITNKYNAAIKGAKAYEKFQEKAKVNNAVKPLYDARSLLEKDSTAFYESSIKIDIAKNRFLDTEKAIKSFNTTASTGGSGVKKMAEDIKTAVKEMNEGALSSISSGLNTFSQELVNLTIDGDFSFSKLGESFGQMAKSILADIVKLIIKMTILKPIMNSLSESSFFGGGSGGSSLSFGSFFSFPKPFAKGGVFNSGIIDSPTSFGYGNGETGILGEAGPEAILPLTRGPGGKLGVDVNGVVSNGKGNVNITIYNENGGQVSTKQKQSGDNLDIEVFIRKIEDGVAQNVLDNKGSLGPALTARYGLNPNSGVN